MKLYVSNKHETPRMFKSGFVEFFSRVHWTVPLWIFVPTVALMVYTAYAEYGIQPLRILLLSAAGLIFWSFTEYILHRFVFHFHAKTEWGKKFSWTFHGVHHDYPSDPLRLVMVPAVSLPLATLFFFLFVLTMGYGYATAFAPGFLIGYLFYDITHYAVHHFPIKGKVFGKVREHHMRHHFKEPELGFGVSSWMWDVVFRTTYARGEN